MSRVILDYEHPGLGDDLRQDPFADADMALVRRVGEALTRHYPGHPFLVTAQHEQGILSISLPGIMPQGWGMHICLDDIATDPAFKIPVRLAGELLERYRLPRSGFSGAAWEEALRSQPIGAKHVPE